MAAPKKPRSPEQYEKDRESIRQLHAEQSALGRDIGEGPPIKDPARKESCRLDFLLFLKTYLPNRFPLEFSDDHLEAIAQMQACVLHGDRFALAMARGSGKTSLSIAQAIWATLYAHRHYVMLIAGTDMKGQELLGHIKAELENNELLAEDFPEVCYPIARLERIANRCKGQTRLGEPTRISWTNEDIVFPNWAGSTTSGTIIHCCGLTGSGLRGPLGSRADGTSFRPDLAICDDVQTDESSLSATQNAYREKLVKGAVLGMAGPKTKIALTFLCTVISPGDLAERFLDRDLNPTFNGRRTKMLYAMPTNEKLWDEYRELRKTSMQAGRRGSDATEFYAANREAMDAGAVVAWPARFDEQDLSGLQTAMNIFIDNPRAFFAEYQNDPMSDDPASTIIELDADTLCRKLTNLPRRTVPRECSRLTAFIDVQQMILFYVVCAWDDRFGGSIIDYGSFPEQNRAYFTAADARPTLAETFPGFQEDAWIFAGLTRLCAAILPRVYEQDQTGSGMRIERCLVDARYKTPLVAKFCRESPHYSILLPSQGFGITAAKVPVNEWPKKQGERRGPNWVISPANWQHGRIVKIDVNLWKSFAAQRLLAAQGTPGAVSIFGDRPSAHQLLADHLTAEYRTITSGRGRTLEEWAMRPGRTENHWFDGVVGNCVAASVQGLVWDELKAAGEKERNRPTVQYRDLAAEAAEAERVVLKQPVPLRRTFA